MSLVRFVLRWWAAFALLACLLLLGIAYFVFELALGYPPCELCWRQRWIYVGIAVVAALSWIWALRRRPPGTPPLAALLILLGFGYETYMAVYHAGVELKWWRGPSHCTGGGHVDVSDIRNLLSGVHTVHSPMCDIALWKFMGVSMAGWNAVAAAILTLVSVAAALQAGSSRGR
jgi:disulfide bond formation protein DsbB